MCQEKSEPARTNPGFLNVFAELEVEPPSVLPDFKVSPHFFLSTHMRDPTIVPTRDQVRVSNGESQQPGADFPILLSCTKCYIWLMLMYFRASWSH